MTFGLALVLTSSAANSDDVKFIMSVCIASAAAPAAVKKERRGIINPHPAEHFSHPNCAPGITWSVIVALLDMRLFLIVPSFVFRLSNTLQ